MWGAPSLNTYGNNNKSNENYGSNNVRKKEIFSYKT